MGKETSLPFLFVFVFATMPGLPLPEGRRDSEIKESTQEAFSSDGRLIITHRFTESRKCTRAERKSSLPLLGAS